MNFDFLHSKALLLKFCFIYKRMEKKASDDMIRIIYTAYLYL